MIISLISQKGGVGKSALSRLIAVEYAEGWLECEDRRLDTGQGSTANWKARRDQNGIHPEIPVEKYATVVRAIHDAENYDLMVLDGPAFAERRGMSMAQASDLIIIPTGYSLDDMTPQIETAYALEEQGINSGRIVFVFCRAGGSTSEEAAARSYLKKARVNVLDPVFPERPSIRQAHNTGRAASEVAYSSIQSKSSATGSGNCGSTPTETNQVNMANQGLNIDPPPRKTRTPENPEPKAPEAKLGKRANASPARTPIKFDQFAEETKVQFNKRVTRTQPTALKCFRSRLEEKSPICWPKGWKCWRQNMEKSRYPCSNGR